MADREFSPQIHHVAWGEMKVEGLGVAKDFKLYPGGGREWHWTETGTQHRPGILPADVAELVEKGATTVVLSLGMDLRLEIDPRTITYLKERSITVHLAETREAVQIYNMLIDTTPVGGLFHTTC